MGDKSTPLLKEMKRQTSDKELAERNPFTNATMSWTWYEVIKTTLMVLTMIPLLRLILIILSLIFCWIAVRLATCCHRPVDEHGKPRVFNAFRRFMLWPVHLILRFILFCFGVYWIRERFPSGTCNGWGYLRGRHVPRVLVPNHVSFLEAIYFGTRLMPIAVMKADLVNMPLIGAAIERLHPVLVPRTMKQRAKLPPVPVQLKERATSTDPVYPPILIFPEGTCVNQEYMIQFQRGAFIPGVTVQPVFIKYPYCHFDLSWTPDISILKLALRSLCQVYNCMDVTFLDPYTPSEAEAKDPILFANNVRNYMVEKTGQKTTDHSDHDALLFGEAVQHGFGKYALKHIIDVVPTREVHKHAGTKSAKQLFQAMRRFRDADVEGKGVLTLDEFAKALDIDSVDRADRLFKLFDTDGDGTVNYRELVVGFAKTMSAMPTDEYLDFAFNVYDKDGDGKISVEEVVEVAAAAQDSISKEEVRARLDKAMEGTGFEMKRRVSFAEFSTLAKTEKGKQLLVSVAHVALKAAQIPGVKHSIKVVVEEPAAAESGEVKEATDDGAAGGGEVKPHSADDREPVRPTEPVAVSTTSATAADEVAIPVAGAEPK